MRRAFLVVSALLLGSAAVSAQDMPLSQILIDGEGWKKVGQDKVNPRVKIEKVEKARPFGFSEVQYFKLRLPGERQFEVKPLVDGAPGTSTLFREPTAVTLSPDGNTMFVAWYTQPHIWAYPVGKYITLSDGEPYCSLQLPSGWATLAVGGLTVDKDGRIYAATPIGIQVFDPTGRLCGVLTSPAPGDPQDLAFEGDRLMIWVGDAKYTRKLKTSGVK